MEQQRDGEVIRNEASIAQPVFFDNRVPLNLLPYKKDQITIEHARMTYRYRHVLKRNDSTIGLVYNNENSVDDYRAELELVFDEIMVAGKAAYETQLVCVAKQMGITRFDKQEICNFSDLQQWAVHHFNHRDHNTQIKVLEALTTLFFYKLDTVGRDYWLDRAVGDWGV